MTIPAPQGGGVLKHLPPSFLLDVRNDLRTRDGSLYQAFFQSLVEDARERGIVQPVLAFLDGDRPRVIDGQTRLLAARLCGLETIPVLIFDQEPDEKKLATGMLQANAMRLDMSPLEYARAYKQLMVLNGWSQSQLADHLKISESKISKVLAIINRLPEDLQALIGEGKDTLRISIAAALARLPTHEEMRSLAPKCIGMKRDAGEKLIAGYLSAKKPKASPTIKLTHGSVSVTVKGNAVEALKLFLAKASEAIKRLERDGLPPEYLGGLMG
jgi:ParB family chromosome partitioning protein